MHLFPMNLLRLICSLQNSTSFLAQTAELPSHRFLGSPPRPDEPVCVNPFTIYYSGFRFICQALRQTFLRNFRLFSFSTGSPQLFWAGCTDFLSVFDVFYKDNSAGCPSVPEQDGIPATRQTAPVPAFCRCCLNHFPRCTACGKRPFFVRFCSPQFPQVSTWKFCGIHKVFHNRG